MKIKMGNMSNCLFFIKSEGTLRYVRNIETLTVYPANKNSFLPWLAAAEDNPGVDTEQQKVSKYSTCS